MIKRSRRQEYMDLESFLADIELLKNNAITFNSITSPIAQLAITLEQRCFELVESDEFKPEIDEAMDKIKLSQFAR